MTGPLGTLFQDDLGERALPVQLRLCALARHVIAREDTMAFVMRYLYDADLGPAWAACESPFAVVWALGYVGGREDDFREALLLTAEHALRFAAPFSRKLFATARACVHLARDPAGGGLPVAVASFEHEWHLWRMGVAGVVGWALAGALGDQQLNDVILHLRRHFASVEWREGIESDSMLFRLAEILRERFAPPPLADLVRRRA